MLSTNNQTIEFVSYECSNYEVFIHDKTSNDMRHCCCNIYAHGKLEQTLNYDILDIINVDKFESYIDPNSNFIKIDIPDGVYKAMVVGGSLCRAYIWNTNVNGIKMIKGIVCYNDDYDAIAYAEDKYLNKSWFI